MVVGEIVLGGEGYCGANWRLSNGFSLYISPDSFCLVGVSARHRVAGGQRGHGGHYDEDARERW